MISSDESDGEKIIVKHMPWRSTKVTEFFKQLDDEATTHKSDQAKRQTKQRVLGGQSTRPKPKCGTIPSWAIVS